jgi:hypothetical protein
MMAPLRLIWQGSIREAIKAAHIQAATIGYGGRAEMGSAEYGRIGQRLRSEYTYLQGFVRDLLDGRVSAPMAIVDLIGKVRNYANNNVDFR